MKHRKSLLIATIAIGVFVWSCAKEGLENTMPRSTASSGALNSYLQQITPPTQVFTIDASMGGVIYGSNGTKVFVYPGAFLLPNGNPATGNVTVELIEALTRKQMIGAGAFTTAGGLPIHSGGEVKINAWQGSQELDLFWQGYVRVLIPAGNNPASGMNMFVAEDIRAGADFEMADTTTINVVQDSMQAGPGVWYYEAFPDDFGWTNVDQYMSGASSTVPFSVSFPSLYNDANTKCFVVFNDHNTVMNLYYFDQSTNAFNGGTYYRMPVGFDVTFICVSEINGQFYYAEQQLVVGTSCVLSLTPQPSTQAYIDQKLSAL